jgi:hypothetical protein
MSNNRSIRWDEDDPRNVVATWGEFTLRVRAEQRGTIWMAYVTGPATAYSSKHVSKDAAKQKCAKVAREMLSADKALAADTTE